MKGGQQRVTWETKLELWSQFRNNLFCKQENTKFNHFFFPKYCIFFLSSSHSVCLSKERDSMLPLSVYLILITKDYLVYTMLNHQLAS